MRKPKARIKLKSKRGARKRFKLTAGGRIKRGKAMRRHILTGKAPGRKRALGKATLVDPADEAQVRRMLLA
jgi:large subunit ribosomal protein L35